jgi:gamma-glutamyltranspeptidase/glutathione hydrolase
MVQLVVNIIDHDFNVAEAAMCPRINQGSTQSIMIDGDRFLGAADTRRPDALALGVR